MGNKLHKILIPIALMLSAVMLILLEQFIRFEPVWLRQILLVLASAAVSGSAVYGLVGFLVALVWRLRNKDRYINGEWYVVYYYGKTPSFIRGGRVKLSQQFHDVEIADGRTGDIECKGGKVTGFGDVVGVPTTASGFARIDTDEPIMQGVYESRYNSPGEHWMCSMLCITFLAFDKKGYPKEMRGTICNMTTVEKEQHGEMHLFKLIGDAEAFAKKILGKQSKNRN